MTLRDDPLPIDTFRALGYRAVDLLAEYLATMRERPVYQQVPPAQRTQLLQMSLPEEPQAIDDLLTQVAAEVLPYPMGNGHPRFFGWANSPPDPAGVLAEVLAAGFNPSCAGGDHAAIYLEHAVTRWLADLVGFRLGDNGIGLFTSGGSMASLTAIAVARHTAAQQDGWSDREEGLQHTTPHGPLVLYLTHEGHTTMVKAAELLGIGNRQVHYVPVDADLRMGIATLREMVAADRAAGLRPFLVAASAGTVSTGAIDPLDAIADLCAEEGLWFHIDGAIGAVAMLDARIAPRLSGIERADSLALDPHKWLSVPVECGCILLRDAASARDTFSLVPPYVRTQENQGIGGLPWFSEYAFPQTRGFRALKVWMTLAANGRKGLEETICRHNDLAKDLAHRIATSPELELFADPTLAIVCFRVRTAPGVDQDAVNTQVMYDVQASGRAFLTQASLRGSTWLRASVMHYATNTDDLAALIDTVLEIAARVQQET